MKRWISVVAVLVLVLAACTGGTTEDTTATTAGDTTVPDTTEGDTTSTTAAETPDIVSVPTAVPTAGMLFNALATPIPLVAGIIEPIRLAMIDLPRLTENGTW